MPVIYYSANAVISSPIVNLEVARKTRKAREGQREKEIQYPGVRDFSRAVPVT